MGRNHSHDSPDLDGERPHPLFPSALHADQHPARCDPHSPGLRMGCPAMLLAIPYLLGAAQCVQLIENGGPGWLSLLVLLALWNVFKMLWIGPISLVLLLRARIRERRTAPLVESGSARPVP